MAHPDTADQSFVFNNSSFYDEIKSRKHRRQVLDQDSDSDTESDENGARQRRAQPRIKDGVNRCYLALVADHRFYKEIGNSNVKLTTAYLVRKINHNQSNYLCFKQQLTKSMHFLFMKDKHHRFDKQHFYPYRLEPTHRRGGRAKNVANNDQLRLLSRESNHPHRANYFEHISLQ
jgi:hypothetical protein